MVIHCATSSTQSLQKTILIWRNCKTPEVEIVNLSMLTFAESPGDHRSFLLDVSTRLLLGVYKYKVCRPVSCRLVTSLAGSVKRYNKIVLEQFEIHRIKELMDTVEK
jgi:hypothetical protein